MRKVKVVFDFVSLPIPEKVAWGRNVYTLMNTNPAFPLPDVPLVVIKGDTDVLESSYLASRSGGKESTVVMHQAEDVWDDNMRKTARYVERIAGADSAIVLSAGFNLAKQPIPAQRSEFSAEAGKISGSVLLRRQAVPGARSYIWQFCVNALPETEDGWKIAEVTVKASVELLDLTPVTKYWFRVASVGSQGTSAYNDPIMHVVT